MDQKDTISSFIPLAKAAQGAEIDRLSQSHYNLSAEVLMEAAGALSTKEILFYLKEQQIDTTSSAVMILCGPGHNGGDGLVVARHLLSEGLCVKIFFSEEVKSPLVKKQKERWEKWIHESQKQQLGNIFFHPLKDIEKIKEVGAKCSVIVDALFGIGLVRVIEGFYADLIKWLNLTDKNIISLDTPSGLNVDTGQVQGE
ncbi:MAG: NAD(P)H-hydrate epimerase, partial [Bdellovibrionales bacterium]|nr:NAD(P)H-hydrate epimerase [Bdellovibrionales bacterium]